MSTTNKLAEVIRKIVREEVRKEVRQVLNEQRKPKVTKKQFTSGLQHALGLEDSVERRSRAPKKQVKYSKNKMLNAILNETAGDQKSGPEYDEYPTMGKSGYGSSQSQTFDRKSLAAKMGYGDISPTGAPTLEEMVPSVDTRGMTNQGIQVDSSVAKALTRDYSELVKKFKK